MARSLYIDHPEGRPGPEGNTLVVGPMGSGKTMLLRTLEAEWGGAGELFPVYVDLSHWIAQIAGETKTYATATLGPRAVVMREALGLSISLGLMESVDVFDDPATFPETTDLVAEAFDLDDAISVRKTARRAIRRALVFGRPLPDDLPSPYAVASTLGRDIKAATGRELALLVDQIDQVSAGFFPPIASLLRRSANHVAVLCTRPCPTAPLREQLPAELSQGNHFRTLSLGQSPSGEVSTKFVMDVLSALPLHSNHIDDLASSAELIGHFMWPSLRAAIQTALLYLRGRADGLSHGQSWYDAVAEVAGGYEGIVESATRNWCRPTKFLTELRAEALKRRGGRGSPVGRTRISLVGQATLLDEGDVGQQEQLLRVLVKEGIFAIPTGITYELGGLPSTLEIAPSVLIKESGFDITKFDRRVVSLEVDKHVLESWTRKGGGGAAPRKTVFVSYWMSDPSARRQSKLADFVTRKLGHAVDVRTGVLQGSPRWSPEIMKKIASTDLLLCDLTVPRRDVFVEYGVAIGSNVPVIQTRDASAAEWLPPAWMSSRQFQFFGEEGGIHDMLETSVVEILDNEDDPSTTWRRDSEGGTLEASPKLDRIAYVGPEGTFQEQAAASIVERGYTLVALTSDPRVDNLEEVIKRVRACATIVLGFDGSDGDYLPALAGGVAAARITGSLTLKGSPPSKRRFYREILLSRTIPLKAGKESIPGLLKTHPRARVVSSDDSLASQLEVRMNHLDKIRRRPA
jgi:hypothetical protein